MMIIGREEEQKILGDLCASHNPEFLALYGRRRIGKTHLIRAFFTNRDDVVFFNTTGSKDGSMVEQIHHFTKEIGDTFYKGAKLEREKNWDNTFGILTNALKNAPNNKKIILFIDELPWMATRNSRFLQSIDYYWNQHWSRDSRVKLIICGSSASWIIHKILKAKGGLHNRITKKIRLEPLDLRQAKLYLQALGIKLNDQQTLQLYMVTGGVPYYLSALKKGLSAIQQIERIAFMKDGLLIDEFDNLFDALFDNGDLYRRIIKIIAKQRYGIGKRKLLEAIGKNAVGSYGSRLLDNLEEAGFIKSFKPLFHKKRATITG